MGKSDGNGRNLGAGPQNLPRRLEINPQKVSWRWVVLAFLSFALVGGLAYSNTFRSSFHLDDYKTVEAISAATGVADLWNNQVLSRRRILADLTFWLNFRFGGHHVEGYHAVNLTIHVFTAFFAFLLSAFLFRTPALEGRLPSPTRDVAAFFVGLVFLCHPIQTQAVTYICQRYAALSGLWYLSGLAAYMGYRLWRGKVWLSVVVLSMIAGFTSKENFFTFVLAVLLCEAFFFHGDWATRFLKRRKEWGLFLALTAFAFFVFNSGRIVATYGEIFKYHLSRSEYLMTQCGVIVRYLGLLFFPWRQNFDWDIQIQRHFVSGEVILPLLLLLTLLAAGVYFFKKPRWAFIGFSIFWFFLTLAVESGFFPLQDLMVEHRLYLAVYGFAFALVVSLFVAVGSMRKYIYLSFYVLLLSLLAFQRNSVYATEYTLWADAAAGSPQKYRPWGELALIAESERDTPRAFSCALKAVEGLSIQYQKDPFFYRGLNIENFGLMVGILLRTYALTATAGDLDRLIDDLYSIRKISGMSDKLWDKYNREQMLRDELDKDCGNIAIDFDSRGLRDQAEILFKKAIDINPKSAANYSNYGAFLTKHGRFADAMTAIEQALKLDPEFKDAQKNLAALQGTEGSLLEPREQGGIRVLDSASGQQRELTPEEQEWVRVRQANAQYKQAREMRQLRELQDLRKIVKRF